ncbi:hypothetical protein [Gardnerella sp. 2492-Sm]|uniref:hypothetical protein n=1 Tax=unclassified Gardnerella TaxID=2628112 RepID=UPI003CFE836A
MITSIDSDSSKLIMTGCSGDFGQSSSSAGITSASSRQQRSQGLHEENYLIS